jgi:DNA gyrase/topoisomerase IV subunit A
MRKRSNTGVEVSLFPFLSILVCMMGVLTLMITGVVLSEINPTAVEEVEEDVLENEERARKLLDLEALLSAAEKERKAAEKALDKAKADTPNPAALSAQLSNLQKQLQQRRATQKSAQTEKQRLQAAADELLQRINELKPDVDERTKRLAELRTELAKRKEPARAATVQVRPTGSGRAGSIKPTFVDCTPAGLTVYEGGTKYEVRRGDVGKHAQWLKLLERLSKVKNESIIFLVRRDGVGTYHTASRVATERYARNGKIPVASDGFLDLSLFNRKKK